MTHIENYLSEAAQILQQIDKKSIEQMTDLLLSLRHNNGRLFILGVGGGAGNASHAVCDFRKIADIEAYAPNDNIAELTARVNDEGWDTTYAAWLESSKLRDKDMIFVFSVGGGDLERNISSNLVRALEYSKNIGAKIIGVVGRDGGYTAQVADACVIIPVVNLNTVTPHTESFQVLLWHLLISDPKMQKQSMKWESVTNSG